MEQKVHLLRKSIKWPEVVQTVYRRAERLMATVTKFPIPLIEIANLQKVQKVVFLQDLLPDGCLEPNDYGFVIYAKGLGHNTEDLYKQFQSEPTGISLLPGRIRFTIAHEIAHTLFYDLKANKPTELINITTPKRLSRTEKICNNLAAKILLPDSEVSEFSRSSEVWSPESIRSFAKYAGASEVAVVLRLGAFVGNGGFAFIDVNKQTYKIKYLSIGNALSSRFIKIEKEEFVSKILDRLLMEPCSILAGGEEYRIKCSVPEIRIGSKAVTWDCWFQRSYGTRWLVTFRLAI